MFFSSFINHCVPEHQSPVTFRCEANVNRAENVKDVEVKLKCMDYL